MLPPELQRSAAAVAKRRGISLGELVRQSLVRETAVPYQTGTDPFWAKPALFHSGQKDLALKHDDALYGPIKR